MKQSIVSAAEIIDAYLELENEINQLTDAMVALKDVGAGEAHEAVKKVWELKRNQLSIFKDTKYTREYVR